MIKPTLFIATACLTAACTQIPSRVPLTTEVQCNQATTYDVTVDSWCGNGCDSYPVSHKTPDNRQSGQRVVLNGTQRPGPCDSQ